MALDSSFEEIKNQIKETPLASLLNYYVNVQRQGTNFVTHCPWHADKKPSLSISESKGMWKCWACDIGGDGFTFVQRYLSLDFKEAMLDIAQKLGINTDGLFTQNKPDPRREMAEKVVAKAAQLYRKYAMSEKNSEYLKFIKKRQISEETASTFQIGLAPNNKMLLNYLNSIPSATERKLALDMALEITLLRRGKNGQLYDSFRDRIVFPLFGSYGKPLGFSARAIRDDQVPKYINSSESLLFHKADVVYGLNFAKPCAREQDSLILVEGQMDCITMHQNGFQNTVATSGVALGQRSLKTLRGLTRNIYLAMDGDKAGIKARNRIAGQFLEEEVLAKYVDLAPHKDPDDFLRKEGRIALANRIKEAKNVIDLQLEEITATRPETTERKLEQLNLAFEVLFPLGTNLQATERVVHTSKRLGLQSTEEQVIRSYSEAYHKSADKKQRTAAPTTHTLELKASEDRPKQVTARTSEATQQVSKAEKFLLTQLITFPKTLMHRELPSLLDFVTHTGVKEFVGILQELLYEIDENEFPQIIQEMISQGRLEREIAEAVASALFNFEPHRSHDENEKTTLDRLIFDLVKKLKEDQLRSRRKELVEKQKLCETDDEVQEVVTELVDIDKQIMTNKKQKQNQQL